MSGRLPAVDTAALELCALVSLEDGTPLRLTDAELVAFRDIGGLVRHVPFVPATGNPEDVEAYRSVVEGAFASRTVVPVPLGTIFRGREPLVRWLELHYFTLADALRFLHDRQSARVRIVPGLATQSWDTRERTVREADLEVTAYDSFRVLRRCAVAFLPVASEPHVAEDGAEAAFLVDREQWHVFTTAVKDEQKRLPDLRFEQTGPWPPYDFVRLDLNG